MILGSLSIVVDVARRGSFSAVARERDLDPSSVSRAVAGIEAELGVRLFQRTTRRLTLTEAGLRYLDRVDGVVDTLEQAGEEARSSGTAPAGTVRLTASAAFGTACLVPVLPAFRAAFPLIKLELLLADANLDLLAERIDLAIRLAPSISADVIATKLFDTHYRVCASPAYLAAAPPLQAPDDLRQHRCLRFALPEFRARWLFRDSETAVREVSIDGDVTISTALALRDAAIAGLGPALLPHWIVDEALAAGTLVDCLPGERVAATSFDTGAWLLYPSRALLPRKVRVTVDFLRTALASLSPRRAG